MYVIRCRKISRSPGNRAANPKAGDSSAALRSLEALRPMLPIGFVLCRRTLQSPSRISRWNLASVVPLIVLPSPYRSILGALMDYVEENLDKDPECWITVVLPEILPARWWQNILHNQRALLLKGALLFKDRVVLTDVPFHLTR